VSDSLRSLLSALLEEVPDSLPTRPAALAALANPKTSSTRLRQLLRELAEEAPEEAPSREAAVRAGGVTVKRAPRFEERGEYIVTFTNGRQARIYRDTDQFTYPIWYWVGHEEDPAGKALKQDELIDQLERAVGMKAPTPARSRAEYEVVTAGRQGQRGGRSDGRPLSLQGARAEAQRRAEADAAEAYQIELSVSDGEDIVPVDIGIRPGTGRDRFIYTALVDPDSPATGGEVMPRHIVREIVGATPEPEAGRLARRLQRATRTQGISPEDALTYHYAIVTEGEPEYLDPVALSEGRLDFREHGKPCCENCGCEIVSGRRSGDESDAEVRARLGKIPKRAQIVQASIACASCGREYMVGPDGPITPDEAERFGIQGAEHRPAARTWKVRVDGAMLDVIEADGRIRVETKGGTVVWTGRISLAGVLDQTSSKFTGENLGTLLACIATGDPLRRTLEAFASSVNDAARESPTGRFGDNKVFISHVYRTARWPGTLPGFRKRLIEAQRAGLVDLSRADLVEAMEPTDVRDSETRYLDTTWHFVRVKPTRGSTPGR
jgi:hypothetical protein